MPRDWDAATYDRLASPMARWGQVVVGWLELAGTETVLDAGCGSGRVTEHLLERLPEGDVIALDAMWSRWAMQSADGSSTRSPSDYPDRTSTTFV